MSESNDFFDIFDGEDLGIEFEDNFEHPEDEGDDCLMGLSDEESEAPDPVAATNNHTLKQLWNGRVSRSLLPAFI